MPTPKSITKVIKKGNNVTITFTNNVDPCKYYLHELCRAALRDVGKFIGKQFGADFYGVFKKRSGRAAKASNYRVYSSKSTIYPRVEIGLRADKVGNAGHAYFQEVGTSKQPRKGIMAKVVENNVETILTIEGKYLTALNSDNPRPGIGEGDEEG